MKSAGQTKTTAAQQSGPQNPPPAMPNPQPQYPQQRYQNPQFRQGAVPAYPAAQPPQNGVTGYLAMVRP